MRGNDRPRFRDLVHVLLLVALLAGQGWCADALRATTGTTGAAGGGDGAFWELRRLLAQTCWLKAHAILHAGVEEKQSATGEESHDHEHHELPDSSVPTEELHHSELPHSTAGNTIPAGEKPIVPSRPLVLVDQSKGAAENEPHGHVHDANCSHEEHTDNLVIPSRARDFRGILGDLERAIKPYLDDRGRMYSKDADQTIPMYRLATWLDPHFLVGYTTGATFIDRVGSHTDDAIAFLQEGARHNPESFEIQMELGFMYLRRKKDRRMAEHFLLRAHQLAPKDISNLSEIEVDAVTDVYRWLALAYRDWGQPGQAFGFASEGLRVVGDDPLLKRIVRSKGS